MCSLAEQYRPQSFADVAGQTAAVRTVQTAIKRGWGGRAYLLTGPSGVGKSTIGAITAHVGAFYRTVDVQSATKLTVSALHDIELGYQCRALPWGDDPEQRTGRCVVLNECHSIPAATRPELLDVLERIPAHVAWVLTTSAPQFGQRQDEKPLISRCIPVALADDANSRKERALWVRKCAVDAGVDGFSELVYVVGMDAVDGNTRELFQLVDSGQLADVAVDALTAKLRALPLDGRHGEQRAELQRQIADLTRSQ